MKYGSLTWIAETYFGLSSGLIKSNPSQSKLYSRKALDTYNAILERSDVPEKNVLPIKLRQITCLKLQGNFAKSYEFLTGLLTEQPQLLDLQIESAQLLEEWGDAGKNEKLILAIKGDPPDQKKKLVWGWGDVARRIQRVLVETNQDSPENSLQEKYWNSRYHTTSCRWKYANKLDVTEDKTEMLNLAKREIEVFASLTDKMTDQWVSKFNHLYTNIQLDLNPQLKKVAPLNWGEVLVTEFSEKNDNVETRSSIKTESGRRPTSKGTRTSISSTTIVWSVVALAFLAGVLFFYLKNSSKQKNRIQQIREKPFQQPKSNVKRRVASRSKKSDSQ